jgi:hypothetical protein
MTEAAIWKLGDAATGASADHPASGARRASVKANDRAVQPINAPYCYLKILLFFLVHVYGRSPWD